MLPETPMKRLQARLATVTDDRKRPLMQVSVESGDLRWALAEITRLTADCARKDAALEPFAVYPIFDHDRPETYQLTARRDAEGAYRVLTVAHFRAAASARGEGSGPRKIGAGLTAQERASREEDEEYEL